MNTEATKQKSKTQSFPVQLLRPHINQLIHTAATGTGIVVDVDALLTPIQPKPTSSAVIENNGSIRRALKHITTADMESRPERNLWHNDEIMLMLNIMQNTGAVELLGDKTIKSESIFYNVERLMQKNGYYRKSHIQIRTKWKFLKSTYNTTSRNGTIPKMIAPQVYQQLHKMLSVQPRGSVANTRSSASNSDCGNSRDASELIISGVEGGYRSAIDDTPSSEVSSSTAVEMANETNSFEHPIFGNRLGMIVKPEPTDAGYETKTEMAAQPFNATGVKVADPFENENDAQNGFISNTSQIQFRTEIKEEPIDVSDDLPMENPKLAASPPNVAPMPPLRVAPFAKEPPAMHAFDKRLLDRPPPPLSMHPASAAAPISIRSSNRVNLSEHIRNTMRSMSMQSRSNSISTTTTPEPIPTKLSSIHLSNEITLQPRLPTGQPKAKKMRANMPPPPPSFGVNASNAINHNGRSNGNGNNNNRNKINNNYNNNFQKNNNKKNIVGHDNDLYISMQPSTSRQALNKPFSLVNNSPPMTSRKRRLNINWPPPTEKLPRMDANNYNRRPMGPSPVPPAAATATRMNAKPNDASKASANRARQVKCEPTPSDRDYFDAALKTLGTTLRQMQRDMLSEFFAHQMDMARKEHEFQMHQDMLLMQAFSEQSNQLMQSASELLNLDAANLSGEEDDGNAAPEATAEDESDRHNNNESDDVGDQPEDDSDDGDDDEGDGDGDQHSDGSGETRQAHELVETTTHEPNGSPSNAEPSDERHANDHADEAEPSDDSCAYSHQDNNNGNVITKNDEPTDQHSDRDDCSNSNGHDGGDNEEERENDEIGENSNIANGSHGNDDSDEDEENDVATEENDVSNDNNDGTKDDDRNGDNDDRNEDKDVGKSDDAVGNGHDVGNGDDDVDNEDNCGNGNSDVGNDDHDAANEDNGYDNAANVADNGDKDDDRNNELEEAFDIEANGYFGDADVNAFPLQTFLTEDVYNDDHIL